MCQCQTRRTIGIASLCFGAGVLVSFVLPGLFLAFIEAAAIVFAGLMLCCR